MQPYAEQPFFAGNRAYGLGGAVALQGIYVKPLILNSVFRRNYSADGGAVRVSSSVNASPALMSGCSFVDNEAYYYGGAISLNDKANVKIANATFSSNSAGDGGAINVWGRSTLSISNSTFAANAASGNGGALFNDEDDAFGGSIIVTNSIFWANTSGGDGPDFYNYNSGFEFVATSILEHGCPSDLSICINVSTDDPKLSSPADHGGSTVTLLPGENGSAIDKGDDAGCTPIDQRGVHRPQGAHCDIGAVEWRPSDDVIFQNAFQ